MHDTGRDKMTEVVGLEVQTVTEGTVLACTYRRTHHGIIGTLFLGCQFLVQFLDDHRRMDITVCTL